MYNQQRSLIWPTHKLQEMETKKEKKYFNGNMVQCFARNVALEDLVDALEKERILPYLTAIQRVKYNVMYALASDNLTVLENLVLRGLNVRDVHLTFTYHKKKFTNVFVSNVPFGVKALDVQMRLSPYGLVKSVNMIHKDFRGYKLPTGDWNVSFEKLDTDIPSYVLIRGWLAYIKYEGQPETCRKCNQTGHVFANCPQRKREEDRHEDTPKSESHERPAEPDDMDTHESSPPNEPNPTQEEMNSTPSMQEEFPEEYKPSEEETASEGAFQEILDNLESAETEDLPHVGTSRNQSQAWADSKEESCKDDSEKPQRKPKEKTKIKTKVGPTVYCPLCQVDSHTEEQCEKVSSARLTAKRKLDKKDSKRTRGESVGKKRKNIQGFKVDLESVVTRGNKGSDVQYILDCDDLESLCALWLITRFGHRITAPSVRHLYMAGNTKVMELWTRYSSENMSRLEAEELLMRAYEQF